MLDAHERIVLKCRAPNCRSGLVGQINPQLETENFTVLQETLITFVFLTVICPLLINYSKPPKARKKQYGTGGEMQLMVLLYPDAGRFCVTESGRVQGTRCIAQLLPELKKSCQL